MQQCLILTRYRFFHNGWLGEGLKKKRADRDPTADVCHILTKFLEAAEQEEMKRRLTKAELEKKQMRIEAELDDKRRQPEKQHNKNMMLMMISVMQ